jgi:phosphatidylglycerophosphatase A
MGTLASIPLYLLLVQLPLSAYIVMLIVTFFIGIKICQVTSDDMGVHDHGSIVWDEFVGMWLTMLIVPLLKLPADEWKWLITGFVLFRFFDMVKPWPIGWLDARIHGGLGIMIDDIVAGIMAGISLYMVGLAAGWL